MIKNCKKHNYIHLGSYTDYKNKRESEFGTYYELQRCKHCGKRRKAFTALGSKKFSYNC